MAKILIEFYSKKTPENLISILNESFDSAIFFYAPQKAVPSIRRKSALCDLVKKLLNAPLEFREIPDYSIASALEALQALWDETSTFLIDMTGGDEAFLAAAGIFAAEKGKSVSLHQYDVPSGKKLYSYPVKTAEEEKFPHYVSVPELLTLNGTAPLSAPSYTFSRGPLKGEILRLWEAVRAKPKEWNRFCALDHDAGVLLTQKILDSDKSASAYKTVSQRLKDAGILTDEKESLRKGKLCMEFALSVSDEAKFLYDKAGNLLEMYCALCAYESGIFHDIRVGVTVDWDGRITGTAPDPRNEVDLILMRENLPILVSCKNTAPQNEHLYEIMIMAKHYGGYFATPALFSTGRATESIRTRAAEMGIVLIDGIRSKSPEQMTLLLQKTFQR